MDVEIWSDIVCPWCYLGKRRLEQALAQFDGRDQVRIVHRSFQLDPSRPVGETENRRQMLMRKYGWSAAQAEGIDAQMEARAAGDGLTYRLDDRGVTGNTRLAHELVHFARAQGKGDEMLERLYRAYFTDGQSIFDVEPLVALAGEVGVDPAAAREALERGVHGADVEADTRAAAALGVRGVPFFVVDRRFGVSGAQPVEVLLDTLARARTAAS